MDRYYYTARLLPAAITAAPLVLLYHYTLGSSISVALGEISATTGRFFSIAPPIALIFLLVQLIRFLSKELFQRIYFQDELAMPTTRYLLGSSTYFAPEVRQRLRTKLRKDFDLSMPSAEEEQVNVAQCQRQAVACVAQIRTKLRGNAFLLRHNMEFGFFRNLLGGCVLAVAVAIFDVVYFRYVAPQPLAFRLSVGFCLAYLIPIAASKILLTRFGHYYAKVLFEEYLAI